MKYLLLFTLTLWASYSSAQIYSCKAPNGKTSFQAQPCGAGEVQTEKVAAAAGGSVNPPGCNHPLLGRWRQTHVSEQLDKNRVADASQFWTFAADGTLEHSAFEGRMVQRFPYSCAADTLSFESMAENKLEIIRSTPSTMVWRSIDFGGFIYVAR